MHKSPKSKLFTVAMSVLVVSIGGCSSGSKGALERNPAPCPNILVLNEAARIIEFDGEQKLENVAFTGEITNVSASCRYFDDKPISGALEIDFAFGKGPRAQENRKDFTYFVAITRRDREVIAKREFTVRGNFSNSRDVDVANEKISNFVIPRADDKTSGTNFEIIVGFGLSREQAIFNRSGRSLKFPNLK